MNQTKPSNGKDNKNKNKKWIEKDLHAFLVIKLKKNLYLNKIKNRAFLRKRNFA